MAAHKKLSSISVFFPCYNEAQNIPPLIHQFAQILPQIASRHQLLIINDGSTDDTIQVTKQLLKQYPSLELVNHTHNQGYGATLRTGIKHAKCDWVFYTDGDGQFKAEDLRKFIPYTREYTAILGYRHSRADGQLRAINARLFKLFIDLLYRLHVRDIDCAYKLIDRSLLHSLPLQSSGAMISTEILYRLKKKGIKFKQLPVNHYPRMHGQPTGNNPKVILKAGLESIRLYINLKFLQQT